MSAGPAYRYVDERRTHEVRSWFERGAMLDFVVEERAFGSESKEEAYRERRAVREPWEAKLHQMALEARLALLGKYHRGDAHGWAPVRPAQASAPIDLAALALDGSPDAIEFHHFEAPHGRAITLAGVREETARGPRWALARLAYAFPDVDRGDLRLVHPKLPTPVYRSVVAAQHVELRDLGHRKLPAQARNLLEPRAWRTLRGALDDTLSLLVERGVATLRNDRGVAMDTKAVAAMQEALRASADAASRTRAYDVEDELDPAASVVAGKRPSVMMDQTDADVMAALRAPALLALHARLLRAGEEARLMDAGERAIALAMRALRERTRADEQHLVSILEASLLLRHALAKRVPVDPNVVTRVKHAAALL